MGYMIGDYEVVEKLGSGAMGDVFKGRNRKTNEFVAIKILSEELSNNQRAVERFKREIQQTIQLDHPNLITAYTAGEFKGRLYYVMEYVEGVTAKKELLTRGPYDEFRAVEIIIQLAKALEYAAKFGIIHRDIKPDNIMITYDGKAKLCDMGLAKSTESENKLTILGTVLGTPHYMSPEQAQGEENLDTKSDIFSLGSTSYHLLTGSPPYEGEDPISIMTALIESEPTPIQDRNPKVSDPTCAVIAKMTAKDKGKRYQTFTEVLQDLYKLKKREMTSAQQSGMGQTKTRQQKFKESHVPNEVDILLAQIAVHNKIVSPKKLEECFIRQESLALVGIHLNLSDALVELRVITPQQRAALEKAKMQFILDRGDEVFIKVCNTNNFLKQNEVQELQKFRKARYKGLGGLMVSHKIIGDDKREKIYASIRHAVGGEEGKLILKTAMENNLVSKQQAENAQEYTQTMLLWGNIKILVPFLWKKGFFYQKHIRLY